MNGIKSLNAIVGEQRRDSFNGHRSVNRYVGRIPVKFEAKEKLDSRNASHWHRVVLKKTVTQ